MKIGIITLYYNSVNYGGNLQAYALYQYLKKNKVDVEQISFRLIVDSSFKRRIIDILKLGPVEIVKKTVARVVSGRKRKRILVNEHEIECRRNAFKHFANDVIQHSTRVYDRNSIYNCVNDYDIFITGSDQVWNFAWYDPAYFLDFVDGTKKKKVAYAASFSMEKLTNLQKRVVANSLKDYAAISVREKQAVTLLDGLIEENSVVAVDPTLLLNEEEWNEICADRVCCEEYVFGYFLGANIEAIKVAKLFAQQKKLKFIMIPFPSGSRSIDESGLADISVVDASPEKFLSLIKHAEYVFTDSFHAVVFSIIFKKQFFVFNRDKQGSMNSRIISLTEMFDLRERFCATREMETLECIEGLKDIDYSVDFPKFRECREKSYEFIRKNILEPQS